MWNFSRLVFGFFLVHFGFCEITFIGSDPVVQIESGMIRGTTNTTNSGETTYSAFRGIPYANQPARFKNAEKVTPWAGTYNATKDCVQCFQTSSLLLTSGSEDCLCINVYVPRCNTTNMTVMFYIHGGAFTNGNSSYYLYGPDSLLDRCVIFVSFNYRLGVFGFLSTLDSASPGNKGLADQLLALQWTQTNIASFGGNPLNVTIFGESAGAASVAYQLQIAQSAGLYSGAIIQSGSSLCLWALTVLARRIAFAVGRAMGLYYGTNSTVLVQRLSTANAYQLQTTSNAVGTEIMAENALMGLGWGPVYDGTLLTGSSYDALQAGAFAKVNIMTGVTSNEASIVSSAIPDPLIQLFRAYLINYDLHPDYLPPYDLTRDQQKRTQAGNDIREHYFDESFLNTLAFGDLSDVIRFVSDDQFGRPEREAVTLYSQYVNTYYYVFSYEGSLSGITQRDYKGAGHTEDLAYIFESHATTYTSDDILMKMIMCYLWTNFAKYGNPTPTADPLFSNLIWPAVDPTTTDVAYFNINKTLSVEQNPFQDTWHFYVEEDGIYDQFGDNSYSTF